MHRSRAYDCWGSCLYGNDYCRLTAECCGSRVQEQVIPCPWQRMKMVVICRAPLHLEATPVRTPAHTGKMTATLHVCQMNTSRGSARGELAQDPAALIVYIRMLSVLGEYSSMIVRKGFQDEGFPKPVGFEVPDRLVTQIPARSQTAW